MTKKYSENALFKYHLFVLFLSELINAIFSFSSFSLKKKKFFSKNFFSSLEKSITESKMTFEFNWNYIFASTSKIISAICSNFSIIFGVDYITKTLAKSCKILPGL